MNPKNLQNNDELACYLKKLGKRLNDVGLTDLSEKVVCASQFTGGSPSEFLYEALNILKTIIAIHPAQLKNDEINTMKSVIIQIKDAFRSVGDRVW